MAEDEREQPLRKIAKRVARTSLTSLEDLTPDQMRDVILELEMQNEELIRAEAEIARLTTLYAVLSRVNEAIVRIHDEEALYQDVCRIVAEEGGFLLVWIGRVKKRQVTPAASSGPAADYLKEIRVDVEGEFGRGPTGTCIREERPVVNDDFDINPSTAPWREVALRYGFRASAAFPLRRQGGVVGALTLYAAAPGVFDRDHVKLLEALCADISYALDAMHQEQLRTKAEEALRESEEQFRTMFELAAVGMVQADPRTGRLLRVNEKYCAITGYSAGELLGRTFPDFTDPEDRERDWQAFQRAARGETPDYRSEKRYVRKDGTVVWVNANAAMLRDAAGEPVRTVAAVEDITDRKRAEAALRDSEERFRMIASSTPDHLLIQDRELGYSLVVNPQLGLTEEDMIGKTDYDILAKEDADKLTAIKRRVLDTGEPVRLEAPLTDSTGALQYFEGSYVPTFDEKEQVTGLIGYFRNITDRKRAEEALRASEEQYRRLVELSPEAIYVNRDNRIELLNSAAVRLFGATSADQVLGKSPFDLFHPEFHPIVRERIQKLLEGRSVPVIEEKIVRLDGTDRDVEVAASFYDDERGRAIQVIFRDITERRKAEEALRKSEEQFRALVSASSEVLYRMSPDWSEMRQLHSRDFLANTESPNRNWLQEYIHPDDQPQVTAVIQKAVRTKSVFELEHRVRQADGSLGWTLSRAVPLMDANGEIVEWVGAASDMTGRKRAEEALRRSEARWNAAIENFGEGAIIATEDEQVIYWNPAAREMHGFTRPDEGIEPLKATPITFQLWTPDGSHMLELDEWPMRRIKRGESVRNLELRIHRPDQGWEKVFSYSGAMVETAGGERLIFLSCYDLTEPRRGEQALRVSEEALRQANEQLEEKVRERTAELTTLTENLLESRDQLRSLASELVVTEARERRALASDLHDSVAQMLAIAQMTLKLAGARLEGKSAEEVKRAIQLLEEGSRQTRFLMADLSPSLLYEAGLGQALRALAEKMGELHSLAIEVVDDGSPKPLGEDCRVLVYRAVQELLYNVVKHAQATEVTVALQREGRMLRIEVKDDGVGFPTSERGLGDETRERFGLFSIRERLQHLEGSFEVFSEPGRGVRAVLVAPLQVEREGEGGKPAVLRILIADDHKLMRDGLRGLLEKEPGFQIVGEAANGLEAVHRSNEAKPDVVIMDINMPIMDGIEATRRITQAFPEVKVIGLTAYGENSAASRVLDAGASSFVLKGSSSEELIKAIRTAVGSRKEN